MQWNCPHCGISLAIASESLGTGWSFSRCYKCGAFALVRKTEVNVIKVDKAPPGERIPLLPEAVETPNLGLFSKSATDKLIEHAERATARHPDHGPSLPAVPGFPEPLGKFPRKQRSSKNFLSV